MKIKFEDNERHILSAFLFQTRKMVRNEGTKIEYSFNTKDITEDEFQAKSEMNQKQANSVKKLINKFVTPSVFVKLKRRDVNDLREIISHVIEVHENSEVGEDEKPHLTAESYETCKSALDKLEDGIVRSMAQDRK